MEDYNLLYYNQHQLMKRAPTLVTGPSLVFLAPTKKGLRSPILKCKTLLASLMPISDCHQSAAIIYLCCSINLYWSTSAHYTLLVNLLINTTGNMLMYISPS